ncbi:hypothetical protein KEJ27_09835 [Candidatus Bathyarchaeota archaeon]|nr:hypothetical protein [Candidatus Bathyarchaeota archaeon]
MHRYVLAVLSPRDLNFFWDSLERIDYIDIAVARYMETVKALETIRMFALEKNYDYIIIIPDDTIIPYTSISKIMIDCELFNHKIVTGYSRIRPGVSDCNVTLNPPWNIENLKGKPCYYQFYKFLKYNDVIGMLSEGKDIVKVWFVGWSLTAVHREVFEKVKFRGWITLTDYYGVWNQSCDLAFSYDVWKLGYEPYCDLTVYIPHLPTGRKNLNIGVKPEEFKFKERKRSIL